MRYLLLGLSLLLLASLFSSVRQIQPGERAVVRRFGRVLEDKPGPGLHFFLPWGMDRVDIVKIQELREVTIGQLGDETDDDKTTPAGQLLTGDHNLVDVQVKLYYTVRPEEIEKFVLQADRADGLLQRLGENALAEWVGGRPVQDILLQGKEQLPAWLAVQVQRRLEQSGYDLGIEIGPLPSVTHLSPPPEVKPDFDAVTQADKVVETRKNQAAAVKGDEATKAKGTVKEIENATATYQVKKREQAEKEIEVFEKELFWAAISPHYRTVRWWNALSRIHAGLKGRVEPLDHYLTPDGLNITTTPLAPRKR